MSNIEKCFKMIPHTARSFEDLHPVICFDDYKEKIGLAINEIKKLQAENAELFRLKEVFKARNNKALDYLYEESQDSAYDARCALEGE